MIFDLFKKKDKDWRFKEYCDIEKSINSIDEQLADYAIEFNDRKNAQAEIMKSCSDFDILRSNNERFEYFRKSHLKEIGKLKKERDKFKSSLTSLSKASDFDERLKEYKNKQAHQSILNKYRDGQVNLFVCDSLIKAKTGELVRYADNLVFNEDGKLLLLKRSELEESKPGYFTVPGGHVDPGEECEDAAKRELEEEAGIRVEDVELAGEYKDEKVHIKYYRSYVDNVEPVLQESEIWSYEWVDPKDLDKYTLPFNMKENILKILNPLKYKVVKLQKSFESGIISKDQRDVLIKNEIEKARGGIYKDTPENRKLGRVGQKYGSKKEEPYLTKEDFDIIEEYCEFLHQHINSELRTPVGDEELETKSEKLSKALSKLPNYKGEVVRFQPISKEVVDFLEDNIGFSIKFKAFTSTSKIEDLSKKKSSDKYLKIISHSGKDISNISNRPEEKEVLFDKETYFKFLGKENEIFLFEEDTSKKTQKSEDSDILKSKKSRWENLLENKEFEEYVTINNKEDRDSGELMDISYPERDRLILEFRQKNETVEKSSILGKYGDKVIETIKEALKNKKEPEQIKGGRADGKSIQDIADHHKVSKDDILKQLKMGVKVEFEHTDSPKKSLEIAKDHLWEIPDYYTRLAEMEKEAGVEHDIEKAAKDISKLKKIKKLIYRDGKLIFATYYVKTGEEVEDKEKVGHAYKIKEDISEGERVAISTKRKKVEGIVSGFSFNKRTQSYWIAVTSDDGEVDYLGTKSITKFSKTVEVTKEIKSIPKDSKLTTLKDLGGSSGVLLKTDIETTDLYAVKTPHKGDIEQIKQEKTINDLYRALGYNAPESEVDEDNGVLISKFITDAKELRASEITPTLKREIQKGFVLDALLANWDVIGQGMDNILVKNGEVYRIDNGGCLETRAKGGHKEYSDNVPEIRTLREYEPGKNIFSYITDSDITEQVDALIEKKDIIEKSISSLPEHLQSKLMKRLSYLENEYRTKKTKKVESVEVLRPDMPSLVTQKYFDTKWGNVNIEGNEGINKHIRGHIIEIEKKFEKEYQDCASNLGMTVEEFKTDLQKMVEGIVARSKGYIVAHSSAGFRETAVVGAILSEGRFKTQFETGTSEGSLSPRDRSITESAYFGFDGEKEDKSMRPVYGFFTDIERGIINERGTIPPPRSVGQYGDVCFEVKDSKFRKDGTITFTDSLSEENYIAATPVSAPHFTSVRPRNYNSLKSIYENKVSSSDSGYHYVETQYHGKLTIDDIERVHVTAKEYKDDFSKLSKVINEINASTLKGGKLVPIEIF